MLAKIEKVACNDISAFAGVESDIKIKKDGATGEITVDLIAHSIISDEDKPEYMNVNYAAAKCIMKNANQQTQNKACELVEKLVQSSIKNLNIDENEKQKLTDNLKQRGQENLLQTIQQQ